MPVRLSVRPRSPAYRTYSTQDSIDSQARVWTVLMAATAAGLGRAAAARGAASGRGRYGLHGGGRRVSVAAWEIFPSARALIPVSIPVSM
jgi:hypothetical protein